MLRTEADASAGKGGRRRNSWDPCGQKNMGTTLLGKRLVFSSKPKQKPQGLKPTPVIARRPDCSRLQEGQQEIGQM